MALALVPVVAGAQTARNPYADLFGRAPSQGGGEMTSVQVRSTAGAQIGQTLQADFDQQNVVPEGVAAGADASMTAQIIRPRVQFVGQGRYSYQEFRQPPAFGAPGFDAGGRVNVSLTTRVSLQGGAQFVRSPFFSLMWMGPETFGAPAPPVNNTSAMLMLSNDSAEVNGGLTAQIGKRTSFSALGFTRQTEFASSPQSDFSTVGGRAVLRHQLTRSLGVRAGYAREQLRAAPESGADNYVNEILDVGVDFAKGFSMGRRTMFVLATETSMVREDGGDRQFRLNGTVGFERRFLRTWITQLTARRATEFVPGFIGPVFTDHGTVSLAGYLTKRLLFNASGDGGRGAVGRTDGNQFISYTGNAALTFAVTRHFGVFGQYGYYRYQMPSDPLALVTVQHLSRQAVSIGVKTWISIIDKEQVPSDPR